MPALALLLIILLHGARSESTTEEIQFLNELPLDKLLKLKQSLQDLSTPEYEYENVTTNATPSYLESFGAQAMALKAPKRKSDEEVIWHKGDNKISNIFSMSVTTLAFLAFGGYLLCLIVQAVRAKQMYLPAAPTVQPATIFVSNIKKRPTPQVHSQFASYGRRRRAANTPLPSLIDPDPHQPGLSDPDTLHSGLRDPVTTPPGLIDPDPYQPGPFDPDTQSGPSDPYSQQGWMDPDLHQLQQIDLPPDQLFAALLHVCEGYARWSGDLH